MLIVVFSSFSVEFSLYFFTSANANNTKMVLPVHESTKTCLSMSSDRKLEVAVSICISFKSYFISLRKLAFCEHLCLEWMARVCYRTRWVGDAASYFISSLTVGSSKYWNIALATIFHHPYTYINSSQWSPNRLSLIFI